MYIDTVCHFFMFVLLIVNSKIYANDVVLFLVQESVILGKKDIFISCFFLTLYR